MQIGRRVVLATIAFAVAIGAIWVLAAPRPEPVYQGRPLSAWILEEVNTGKDAREAIQQMGDRATPQLLRWATYKRPVWFERIRRITFHSSPKLAQWLEGWDERKINLGVGSIRAFKMIGSGASKAIPALRRMLKDAADLETARVAATILSYLGDEGRAPLTQELTNQAPQIRAIAAGAFFTMGTNAYPSLPQLVNALQDREPIVVSSASASLAELQPDTMELIPALIKLLQNPGQRWRRRALHTAESLGEKARAAAPVVAKMLEDPDRGTRFDAETALRRITPEAFTNAPSKYE